MIQLIKGDCLEVLASYPGKFACIITSPPYNLGIPYPGYDDSIPRAEYLEWCGLWLNMLYMKAEDDASLFLNVGGKPADPLVPEQVLSKAVEARWRLQNKIHYIKSITTWTPQGEIRTTGHFKPINSDRFVNDCVEMIYHLTKSGDVSLSRKAPGVGVPMEDKTNLKRFAANSGSELRCRGNAWFLPYSTRQESNDYPATFPVELPKRCLALHGVEKLRESGKLVLDPFSGSGSTMEACKELGVNGVGIELSEEGHQIATRRLHDQANT